MEQRKQMNRKMGNTTLLLLPIKGSKIYKFRLFLLNKAEKKLEKKTMKYTNC